MLTAILGTLAAILTIVGFVPQAWRIIKTRDTEGLAAAMWICSTASFGLWTLYGVFLGKLPIVIPNAICCVLAGFILTMKLLPRHKRDRVADTVEAAIARRA
jgi:MtN3 and saliva related transmembrane protein